MNLLIVYIVCVVIGQSVTIGVGLAIDRLYSPHVSLVDIDHDVLPGVLDRLEGRGAIDRAEDRVVRSAAALERC